MGSTGGRRGGGGCPLVPSVGRIWIPFSGPSLLLAPKSGHITLGSVQEREEVPVGELPMSRQASVGVVRRLPRC